MCGEMVYGWGGGRRGGCKRSQMKEEVDRRGGGGVGEEKWRRDLETEEVG